MTYAPRSSGSVGDQILKIDINEKTHYYIRYIFDFTIWVVINLILLNMIFGVIIDTFADMRDKKKKFLEEIKNSC